MKQIPFVKKNDTDHEVSNTARPFLYHPRPGKAPPNFAILQDIASKFCCQLLYLFSLHISSKNDVPVNRKVLNPTTSWKLGNSVSSLIRGYPEYSLRKML